MGLCERCCSGKAGPGTPQIFNPVGREKTDRHLAVGGAPADKCPQSNNAVYKEFDECIQCTSLRRKRRLHIFQAGSAGPSKPPWTVRRGVLGWFARRAPNAPGPLRGLAHPLPPCRHAGHTGGSAARLLRDPAHHRPNVRGACAAVKVPLNPKPFSRRPSMEATRHTPIQAPTYAQSHIHSAPPHHHPPPLLPPPPFPTEMRQTLKPDR